MNSRRFLLQAELIGPPISMSNSDDSDTRESNFDTNMLIILAALLCALICSLGLNSIVRCALYCSRRFAADASEQASARLANTGIKEKALSQIPVVVYGSGRKTPATECPTCLGDFADGVKVRMPPKCNHGFHVGCIDTWLRSHSSCPNCQHSLLERPSTNSHATDASLAPPPSTANRTTTHQATTPGLWPLMSQINDPNNISEA